MTEQEKLMKKEIMKNPVYREWDINLPPCVIVDIDGTLAHMNGKRGPYEYDKVHLDDINGALRYLLGLILGGVYLRSSKYSYDNFKLFIVSGRSDDCRSETEEWLYKNKIQNTDLYMRKSGDKRCDSIVKEEIYKEHIEGKYNVIAVFDDRNRVVDMWRRNGLFTLQVWYGDF